MNHKMAITVMTSASATNDSNPHVPSKRMRYASAAAKAKMATTARAKQQERQK